MRGSSLQRITTGTVLLLLFTLIPAPKAAAQFPVSVNGRVLAPDGVPVAEAQVALYDLQVSSAGASAMGSGVSGADGRFKLTAFPAKRYGLIVQAKGFALCAMQVSRSMLDEGVPVHLRPATTVRIPIIGTDAKPVPNVKVGVVAMREAYTFFSVNEGSIPPPLQDHFAATTDANGICTLENMPRGYSIIVKTIGGAYIAENTSVEVPDAPSGDVPPIRVTKGALVRGRVIRADAGQGVANVAVNDRVTNGRNSRITGTVTDAEGGFEIPQTIAGEHVVNATLSAEQSGQFAVEPTDPVTVAIDEQSPLIVVKLVPGVVVRGAAVDESTGRGIPGASISLDQNANRFPDEHAVGAVTDANGAFVIHALPGEYMARISGLAKLGYQLPQPNGRRVTATADREASVEFLCNPNPNAAVKGRVVDDQAQPLVGATVIASVSTTIAGSFSGPDSMIRAADRSGGETITDADGKFLLPFVTDAATLTVRKEDFRLPQPIRIDSAHRDLNNLVVRKLPKGSLLVQVQDNDGKPLSGAVVSISWSNGDELFGTEQKIGTTGADGTFRAADLGTQFTYSVNVAARNYTYSQTRDLRVNPDQETIVPVVKLTRADGFIEGVLVDQHGKPIPGADVRASGRQAPSSTVRTDMNGHFRVEQLVPGTAVAIFPRVDGRGPSVSEGGFPVGTTDLILTFDPDKPVVGPVQGGQ